MYITNKEVPYKVKFFNELSKYCNLKVIFETLDSMNRNKEWAKSVKNNFEYKFTRQNKMKFIGILNEIKKYKYDIIIFGCVNDINQIIAMIIMRLFNKKYILSIDGECFIGNSFKDKLKILFIKCANKYLVAGEQSAKNIEKVVKNINLKEVQLAAREGREPRVLKHIHPHAFRHTFATRCFEKGLDPLFVQSIMGHSNYSTTISYTHVLDDTKQKEVAKVGNFLD